MAVFDSQLDTNSPTYKANAEVMAEAVAEFRGVEQNVLNRANGKAPAYEKRGYMAPRDRLSQLLDAGSPWLELSSLCGFMQDQDKDGSFAGGSVIAGIGYRGMAPRFMFAWPRSVVSVMGPPQAGQVMRQVWQAQMKKKGEVDEEALDRQERAVIEAMEAQSHALANTARVWDDAFIDPRDTRDIVAFVLEVCRAADSRQL